jgi:hemolysin III
VACVIALPAGVFLVASAQQAAGRVAAAIYVASLLLLFGTSAAYHRSRGPRVRPMMRRLDHAMIYLLIAGSYTPVCLVALPRSWGIPMLVVVVTGAVVGMVLKLAAFSGAGRYASLLYPVLGWVVVPSGPVLIKMISPAQLALFVLGGLAYTIGFPVLVFRRPDPWPSTFGYHEVWHACTIVAAVFHFAGIATLVT